MRKQAILWTLGAMLFGSVAGIGPAYATDNGQQPEAAGASAAADLQLSGPRETRNTADTPSVDPLAVGTHIGDVLSTDIQAFVDGQRIPSMNIDGYTAVAAEDLRRYGFDVVWNPRELKVTIYNRMTKVVEPLAVGPEPGLAVGTKMGDVLFTDIRTFYAEQPIRSFNIGGRTAIVLNDLKDMGLVEWSEPSRTIRFTPAKSESPGYPPREETPLVIHERETVRLDDIQIGDQTVTYGGQTIGRIVDGKAMISLRFLGKALGYKATCDDVAGHTTVCLSNGVYGFETYAVEGNRNVQLYWTGGQVKQYELFAPVVAENESGPADVLVYERDLQKLFGYNSQWDPDTGMLDIQYIDYVVDDYGVRESADNYQYILEAVGRISGQAGELPMLSMRSRSPYVTPQGSEGGLLEEGKDGLLPKYRFRTMAQLELGSPYFDVQLSVGQRLLYNKSISFRLGPENVRPGFDVNALRGRGDFSHVTFDQADKALIVSDNGEVAISGKVDHSVGSGLVFAVEKATCENCWVWEPSKRVEAPFRDGRFDMQLNLPDEPWLYRIRVYSTLQTPRFTSELEIGRYFVQIPRH